MPSNGEVEAGLTIARRRFRESLDRIRTLEAQRDELLAALEAVIATGEIVAGKWQTKLFVNSPELVNARKAINRAKGTQNAN